jgi:putative tryptophan/tyrosine transport system substrate-binding protein
MRRREFIGLVSGATVTWPLAVRAQQSDRVRRVGWLIPREANDPEGQARVIAFRQGLQDLGWIEGRNLQIEYRWSGGDAERIRTDAAGLVALSPDVIVATATATVAPLQQLTRSVPIVFVAVVDPVGAGFVASLARPGGNVTGFSIFEYGTSAKWLELLKQIAPGITRAAVIRDPAIASGIGQLGALQVAAPSFGVELTPVDVRDGKEVERAVADFASGPNGGLIVVAGALAAIHRDNIIALAARHHLPAIYSSRYYIASGGLASYGPDSVDPYRRTAGYVDRILKGEKAADLPVQAPTKYERVINLKTAKALGLTIPQSLLARADEVIE